MTRKFVLSADVDLATVAEQCPVTLSGADLYALCADAWMLAFKRYIAQAEQKQQQQQPEDGLENHHHQQQPQQSADQQQEDSSSSSGEQITVCQADFLQALAALTPSLSADELARYLAIKQHYDAQQGFGQASVSSTPAAAARVPAVPAHISAAEGAPEGADSVQNGSRVLSSSDARTLDSPDPSTDTAAAPAAEADGVSDSQHAYSSGLGADEGGAVGSGSGQQAATNGAQQQQQP